MIRLSVNVNKVATVRNSRGGATPSVLEAVRVSLDAGVRGITVHPRADERHITARDVRDIAAMLAADGGGDAANVELNIEGDPRSDWLALVREVKPQQATLVPVRVGEITSEAGWRPDEDEAQMRSVVDTLKAHGVRVSLFVEPELAPISWAKRVGADRVELYTEPFARAFEQGAQPAARSFERYASASQHAHALGLGVNAGHDLDLENLVLFRRLPHLAEVSIGHALIGRALFVGLERVVREYLELLK